MTSPVLEAEHSLLVTYSSPWSSGSGYDCTDIRVRVFNFFVQLSIDHCHRRRTKKYSDSGGTYESRNFLFFHDGPAPVNYHIDDFPHEI